MLTSLLSALLAQTLYGPTAPPPPPPAVSASDPTEVSPTSSAAVFRANGMTEAGLAARSLAGELEKLQPSEADSTTS